MNLQEIKFNFKFNERKEAKLFVEKHKELKLPISLLGKEFYISDQLAYFVGLEEIKSNSINLLNNLTKSNYKNNLPNIYNYNVILELPGGEHSIPDWLKFKSIKANSCIITIHLPLFLSKFKEEISSSF